MRIIFGAVAGLCATMAMTMAMRRLYALLPPGERYPLPPAEILASVCGSTNDRAHTSRTVLAHFLYGSLSGAIYPLVRNKLGGQVTASRFGPRVTWDGSRPRVFLLRQQSIARHAIC